MVRFLVRSLLALVFTGTFLVSNGGCQTPQHSERGAILGALGGAGVGALIGDKHHAAGPGAIIGAGVGTLAGAAIGESIDRDVERNRQQASAQTAAMYEQRARQGAVTPEDVGAMLRAGLSEDVIAGQIRANGMSRQLQVNDLINLRNQGVPDSVIKAMQTAPLAAANPVPVNTYGAAPASGQQVIVEHHYGPPAYYYRPAPWCWHGPPHGHFHHHHGHHGPPSPRVSWGISFGR